MRLTHSNVRIRRYTEDFTFGPRCCFGGGGGDGGAGAARAAESERQAKIAQATSGINKQFEGFDEPYFKNIADSYRAFQQPLLTEQLDVARKKLPMRFASTGSSAYQREAANLEQQQIISQGEDFANQQRSNVENNRSDLIGQANSGTDATAAATQAMARSAALSKAPSFSPIADLFQKYTAYGANAATAERMGYNTGLPSLAFGVPKNAVTVRK